MNKVYIVTSGEYSDYHIDAVFASREKAEGYVKIKNREDKEDGCDFVYNIEETLLGDGYVNINCWYVRVEMFFSKKFEEIRHNVVIYGKNGVDANLQRISPHFNSYTSKNGYVFTFATYAPTVGFDTEEKIEEYYAKVVRDYVTKIKNVVQSGELSIRAATVWINEKIENGGII